MSDRPWDAAEQIKTQIARTDVLADPTDSAADVQDVAVEFDVPAAWPWEDESRLIRSSLGLDPDGVYEISVRLPETDLAGNDWENQKMLDVAVKMAVQSSSFPDAGDGHVRGGRNGFAPHIVWGGKPTARWYDYEDGQGHHLAARQAVRQTQNVVKQYRQEVRDRR